MLDGVICIRSKIACLYHDDETQRTWPEQRKCWFEPFKHQMSSEIYVAKHTARRVSMAGVEKKHFLFSRTNQAKPDVAFFQTLGIPSDAFHCQSSPASATVFRRKRIAIFEKNANFWWVRSRLYQNEILQENMRLTAFVKLYKMCTLLHRSKLNISAKT